MGWVSHMLCLSLLLNWLLNLGFSHMQLFSDSLQPLKKKRNPSSVVKLSFLKAVSLNLIQFTLSTSSPLLSQKHILTHVFKPVVQINSTCEKYRFCLHSFIQDVNYLNRSLRLTPKLGVHTKQRMHFVSNLNTECFSTLVFR